MGVNQRHGPSEIEEARRRGQRAKRGLAARGVAAEYGLQHAAFSEGGHERIG